MRVLLTCLALIAFTAHAGDARVYQTDKYGNIQYHKPSYTIKSDGRVIQTDAYGNKLYHKQQYLMRDNNIVPIDAYGSRQYSKPTLVIEGRKTASVNRKP
ncbi:MAG: hypothetical protein WD793_11600 [Steroidobacteraceae bacterium]